MLAKSIINYLENITNEKLPNNGIIAGQCVAEAYFRVLNIDIHTRIKDLDIFQEKFYYYHNEESKPINVKFSEKIYKVVTSDYELLVESINNDYHIHSVVEDGIFNYIQITNKSTNNNVLKTIVDRFDINSVQIGINLETKELYMTSYFKEFLQNRQLKIVNYHAFPSSLIRIIEKKITSKNTYLNLEYEIYYGLPLYSHKIKHNKGSYVLDRKYQKLLNIPESKPYIDILNKHFNLEYSNFLVKQHNPYQVKISQEKKYVCKINSNNYCSKEFFSYFEEYKQQYNLNINVIDFILKDYIDITLLNKHSLKCKKLTTFYGISFNFFYTNNDVLSDFIDDLLIINILIPTEYLYASDDFTIEEQIDLQQFLIKDEINLHSNLLVYLNCSYTFFNDRKNLDFFYKLKNKPISDFIPDHLRTVFYFIVFFEEYNYIHFKSHKLNKIFAHYQLFLKLYLLFKNDFSTSKEFFEHTYNFFTLFKEEYLFLIGTIETENINLNLLKNMFFKLNIDKLIETHMNKCIKQKLIIPNSYLKLNNYKITQIKDSFTLKNVGLQMKHCVGGYYNNLKTDHLFYFDIFDENNIRMTLEVEVIQQHATLKQLKLKKNERPSNEQFKNIYVFINNLTEFFKSQQS